MISSCGLSPIVHIDGTMVAAQGSSSERRSQITPSELTVYRYCTQWISHMIFSTISA